MEYGKVHFQMKQHWEKNQTSLHFETSIILFKSMIKQSQIIYLIIVTSKQITNSSI